eukprot:scaffold83763_cov36-Phaeocystis_antarctica.AAC.1
MQARTHAYVHAACVLGRWPGRRRALRRRPDRQPFVQQRVVTVRDLGVERHKLRPGLKPAPQPAIRP